MLLGVAGETGRREARQVLMRVLRYTLILEGLGAAALAALWRGRFPHSVLSAAFHSVSAFCNAGFSLFSDSLQAFRGDPPTLIVVMMLVFAGGLGFPVLSALAAWAAGRVLPWKDPVPAGPHVRWVLLSSAALIAAGAVMCYADGLMEGVDRNVLDSIFQSVTSRTAGFQIESQLRFGALGLISTIVLMAVGASPQSTGGGIRTTVVARLLVRVDREARPERHRIYILTRPFATALMLAMLYLAVGAAGFWALCLSDGLNHADAAFEAFSALGTVGLSRDVSTRLSPTGKCTGILLMYIGRVLFPTAVMWMIRRRREENQWVPWV